MYTVLAATSATLRQMLVDSMAADVGPSGLATFFSGATTVSLETPQEMRDAGRQGLSLWLYRVARDENRLNDPPELHTLPKQYGSVVATQHGLFHAQHLLGHKSPVVTSKYYATPTMPRADPTSDWGVSI